LEAQYRLEKKHWWRMKISTLNKGAFEQNAVNDYQNRQTLLDKSASV
jgi:hypothetical protein